MRAHKNMTLRDAMTLARQLGVKTREDAGEIIFDHPRFRKRFRRVNRRRHDVQQQLVVELRRLEEAREVARRD